MKSKAKKRIHKEYFLTAPLLEAPAAIEVGECVIHLRGQRGYSFIEGPTQATIDAVRDDFVCVVAGVVTSVGVSFCIVFRSATSPSPIAFDSKSRVPQDWMGWAFSRLPLKTIPLVCLDGKMCKQLAREMSKPI